MIRRLVRFTSSKKGAKITILSWIGLVLILSLLAPSAKEFETNGTEGSSSGDKASEIAADQLEEHFPSDDAVTAFGVFYRESGITDADRDVITAFSEWLNSDEAPNVIVNPLPYHDFPEDIQNKMYSDDDSTLIFNFALEDDLESSETYDTLQTVQKEFKQLDSEGLQFEITGPAGIAGDTTSLFKNADFVLMISTIVLIFILLIVIYRSPLLAIAPLLIAALVY